MTSTTLPTLLLDTSVISGLVKHELSPEDEAAVHKLLEMAAGGRVTITASTVSREELERIPVTYRSSHLEAYEALQKIQASSVWLDTTDFSITPTANPEYAVLRAILQDENDARLAYQAKKAGVDAFVTVDRRTILNKADALTAQGVNVVSPSQWFSSTLRSS